MVVWGLDRNRCRRESLLFFLVFLLLDNEWRYFIVAKGPSAGWRWIANVAR